MGSHYLMNQKITWQLKTAGSITELQQLAKEIDASGTGEWVDAAGLFLPLRRIDELIQSIQRGVIDSIEEIQSFFIDQVNEYERYKTSYFRFVLKEVRGIDLTEITRQQVIELIDQWKIASVKLNNMILKDAEKEFDATSHIGYGISSSKSVQEADFMEVHGSFDDNK